MTTKALRELLECIDDHDLEHCSLGDHTFHDATERGAAAIAAGWDVVRVPNALLEAAQQVIDARRFKGEMREALDALANAVVTATGEDEPA